MARILILCEESLKPCDEPLTQFSVDRQILSPDGGSHWPRFLPRRQPCVDFRSQYLALAELPGIWRNAVDIGFRTRPYRVSDRAILTTKSSSSPAELLSGISQTPTRGTSSFASMIMPSRLLSIGAVISSSLSRLLTASHRPGALSSASTRMPTARRLGSLSARPNILRAFRSPASKMSKGGSSPV